MPNCNCKQPPGGDHECPNGHAAFCEVVDGVCKGVCVPVPSRILRASPEDLHAWLLTRLLGRVVSADEIRSDSELASIIRNGEYVHPVTKSVIRFGLPEQSTLPPIRNDDISGSAAGGMMTAG
jgi:hypothetical protein